MLRLRMLTASCVVIAAASILVATAQSAPNKPIPRPPSIASTLSPAVARTPGILAFLKSNNPKSVEFDPTTGKTVWVGKGLITWTGHLIRHVPAGVTTLAGRYQPQT
jgi:hypothetical protein